MTRTQTPITVYRTNHKRRHFPLMTRTQTPITVYRTNHSGCIFHWWHEHRHQSLSTGPIIVAVSSTERLHTSTNRCLTINSWVKRTHHSGRIFHWWHEHRHQSLSTGPIIVAVSSTEHLHTSTNRCLLSNNKLLSEENPSQWPYLPLMTCTQAPITVNTRTNHSSCTLTDDLQTNTNCHLLNIITMNSWVKRTNHSGLSSTDDLHTSTNPCPFNNNNNGNL